MQNIELLNAYELKKIVTCDPHDFNTLKNEYPDLGGNYEVVHHTQFIKQLIESGQLKIEAGDFKSKKITYHDPCYLGRGNKEYEAPRFIINKIGVNFSEIEPNKSRALCCGAGGAQMFKETEAGDKEIYELRTEQALETKAEIIATACPLCMTMMEDGLKVKEKEHEIKVLDIAEIVVRVLGL